ncbi:MAG: PQQ-binding-like beta-propeller repeat protein [Clostridia bacterium]|nr:PQQ-binding-like beta-propeller repeat protein [Clostridia bacterium]
MTAERIFHSRYCILRENSNHIYLYDNGAISKITYIPYHYDTNIPGTISVFYRSGEKHIWNTKYVGAYTDQFGIAVSNDGNYIFLQTWDNGLFCYNAKTGEKVWRTKSKRGITNVFVLDDSVLCQQHDRALQLLDIKTGEAIAERRVTSWGFTAIDNRYIICQIKARQWDLIEAGTLNTIHSFSCKEFTDGHEDYCVNRIERGDNGTIRVYGFKNVFDESVKPNRILQNLEFSASINCDELI